MTPDELADMLERDYPDETPAAVLIALRRLGALEAAMEEFTRAYPEGVFPPLGAGEVRGLPDDVQRWITRASADMGRHVIRVLRRKAADALDKEAGDDR